MILSKSERYVPAKVEHEVSLRDRGECQWVSGGKKCLSQRRTQIHHIVPVSEGGRSTSENLVTLCYFHHDMQHDFGFAKYGHCERLGIAALRPQ